MNWYGVAGIASIVLSAVVTLAIGWLLLVLIIASFG